MLIPLDHGIAMRDLDEANTFFSKASRQQALPSKVCSDFFVDTVELEGCRGFTGQVFDPRHFHLHAEGQFKTVDASFQVECRAGVFKVDLVDFLEHIQLCSLGLLGSPGIVGILDPGVGRGLAGHA